MSYVFPAILIAIGALLVLANSWLWLRAGARRLCPGPRLRWPARLAPLGWIYRPRCAYDLSGQIADAHGMVRCPECGREVTQRSHMLRSPRALRLANLGLTFIAAGALVHRYPPLAATTVVRYTPTNLLMRGEGWLGAGTPLEVREEIRRRAMDHQLNDDQVCRFVRLLVNDLRDDALAWNALEALNSLQVFGLFCISPLVEAVESDDPQQRRYAVQALQSMPSDGEMPVELLRASIVELGADDRMSNAGRSFRFLLGHADQAELLLAEAMRTGDAQQRLLAAVIAGCANRHALIDLAAPILIAHLRDNRVRGDAVIAARGLFGFGAAALPMLEPHRSSADEQQRQSVEYIVRRMTTRDSLIVLQRELPLARLTQAARDALLLEPEALDMPEF